MKKINPYIEKKGIENNSEVLKQSLDIYIEEISEKHRMHRKIKFLLDIRGVLIINKLRGDYVEFGVYRGEMMYSAAKILGEKINHFIGLDTFTGLPEPEKGDASTFVFKKKGFMASPLELAEEMMSDFNTTLISGDFRDKKIIKQFHDKVSKIEVLCIDCNWPSSIQTAFKESAPYFQHGTIIYLDDYFAGAQHYNIHDKELEKISEIFKIRFIEFKTYPPSARAFLVEYL